MNRDDDFNHTLQAWLRREAPSQAPDRVLESALQRVSKASQQRGWYRRLVGENLMGIALRSAALLAVVAIMLFASLQLSNLTPDVGGPSSSATASVSPSALPSPSPTGSAAPSVPTLPSLSPAVGCLDSPPDVKLLYDQTDPVACFGNAPLTFDATLSSPGAVDCPGEHEPAWVYCPADGWLTLVGETGKVGAPFLLVAVDPAGDVSLREYSIATDVRITGHYDDPAAQTCREIQSIPGESPRPAAEVIQGCRQTFVVTQVVPLKP